MYDFLQESIRTERKTSIHTHQKATEQEHEIETMILFAVTISQNAKRVTATNSNSINQSKRRSTYPVPRKNNRSMRCEI